MAAGPKETPHFDVPSWADGNRSFLELDPQEAVRVVEHWRDVAEDATGLAGVELAGPFQRHFTARGTGVPTSFCLVLGADEAIACKFDAARTEHPLLVGGDQFKGEKARWPREALSATALDPGRLAWGVTIEAGGATIPCRTPRLPRNPAAAAVLTALGAELPAA